jgi:hypothetical protein
MPQGKFKTMKSIRNLPIALFILGGFIALISLLHAQSAIRGGTITAAPIEAQSVEAESDLDVMLQAVEMTTPQPADTAPEAGNFYTTQHGDDWPPLPANIANLPVWNLGNGFYLLDDRGYDWDA